MVATQLGMNGLFDLDITRALDSGLTLRPLSRTLADTVEWAEQTASAGPRSSESITYGARVTDNTMGREREAELLALLD